MAEQDKSVLTAFIGAIVGLLTFGIVNQDYAIIGAIIGALMGYALGKGD